MLLDGPIKQAFVAHFARLAVGTGLGCQPRDDELDKLLHGPRYHKAMASNKFRPEQTVGTFPPVFP